MDKTKDNDSGEETDIEIRILDPHFKDQASDSESDSEIDNDGERKQRNQVDPMKVKFGYMKGMDGIFKEKNNNKQKKTRKIDKESHDQIHIQTRTGVDSRTASTL